MSRASGGGFGTASGWPAALVLNLTAGLALRAALPTTLADSGERYRYYLMSLFFPLRECPSFHCFRILPPALASALPFEVVDAFMLVGLASLLVAAAGLFHVARHLGASPAAALWTTAWFWATWGAILSLTDPLLITDPVQLAWSVAALALLLSGRFPAALAVLVAGAAVKESVLLVPVIFAGYAWLTGANAWRRPVWLAVLTGVPIACWLVLRFTLSERFGYAGHEDEAYVVATYFFDLWLPNLGPWPVNVAIAALYVVGAFGMAWLLGLLEMGMVGRERRAGALFLASLPAMAFLSLYQIPERALAALPWAVLPAAGMASARLPRWLAVALLLANLAFTIRMNTAAAWLPRLPVLLAALAALGVVAAIHLRRPAAWTRLAPEAPASGPRQDTSGGWQRQLAAPLGWGAAASLVAALVLTQIAGAGAAVPSATAVDLGGAAGRQPWPRDVALAPDGRRLAVAATDGAGPSRIWLADLESGSARPLAGTDGATSPFWSPDGAALGFFGNGRLKALDLAGEALRDLAEAPAPAGGAWTGGDDIVFAPGEPAGLWLVASAGGDPRPLTTPDAAGGEGSHAWPTVLPGDDVVLFVAVGASPGTSQLKALARGTGETVTVLSGVTNAAYDRHLLLYGRDGVLWAQPFDRRRLRLAPGALRVADRVLTSPVQAHAVFSVRRGRLVVLAPPEPDGAETSDGRLGWVDRGGRWLEALEGAGAVRSLDVTADGEWLAYEARTGRGSVVGARPGGRGASAPGWDAPGLEGPVWRRGAATLAAAAVRQGHEASRRLVRADVAAGVTSLDPVMSLPLFARPTSWSSDGRRLAYDTRAAGTWGVWTVAMDGDGAHAPLVDGPADEAQAEFSPDGRWLAFSSDRYGRRDVFVHAVPPAGPPTLVSLDGGAQPRWRGDGRELVYVEDDRTFVAAQVELAPGFRVAARQRLFELPLVRAGLGRQFAMTADGQRFAVHAARSLPPPPRALVVSDWRQIVRAR